MVDLKKNGLGSLGADQIAWLDDDLRGKSASTPIVLFAHIPLWMVAPDWGWGTEDSAQALALLARFGSVTVLNGHIHQLMQKVEGNVTFHTARSTAFPQPAPGTAPSPGPKLVPAGELRKWLGVREVAYTVTPTELAVTDRPTSRRLTSAIDVRCSDIPDPLHRWRRCPPAAGAAPACRLRSPPATRGPRRAALSGLHGLPFARQERRRSAPPRRLRPQSRIAAGLSLFRRAQILQYRLERGDARPLADQSPGLRSRRKMFFHLDNPQDRADVIAYLRERAK